MRFLAPRVSGAFNCVRWRRRPRGSFAADFFRLAYRARAGLLSRPGRDRQSPGDARGIHLFPSQCYFRPRVMASFNASHPPAVSPRAAASFIVAEST